MELSTGSRRTRGASAAIYGRNRNLLPDLIPSGHHAKTSFRVMGGSQKAEAFCLNRRYHRLMLVTGRMWECEVCRWRFMFVEGRVPKQCPAPGLPTTKVESGVRSAG